MALFIPSPSPPSERELAGIAPTKPGGYWRESGETRGRGGGAASEGSSATAAATEE